MNCIENRNDDLQNSDISLNKIKKTTSKSLLYKNIDYIHLLPFIDLYSYLIPSDKSISALEQTCKQSSLDIPRCHIAINNEKIKDLQHFFDIVYSIQPSFVNQMIPFASQSIMAYPYELFYKKYNSFIISDSGEHLSIDFYLNERKWMFFARKKMKCIFLDDFDDFIHIQNSSLNNEFIYMTILYDSASPTVVIYLYNDSNIMMKYSYKKMLKYLQNDIRKILPDAVIL